MKFNEILNALESSVQPHRTFIYNSHGKRIQID